MRARLRSTVPTLRDHPGATEPPLPEPLDEAEARGQPAEPVASPAAALAAIPRPTLRAGCYRVRFTRDTPAVGTAPVRYDGTLRLERDETKAVASGDLYVHGPVANDPGSDTDAAGTRTEIPIFPRARYRYYVRVTQVENPSAAGALRLAFELHRFEHASLTWSNEGLFSASLRTEPASRPPGAGDVLRGDVRDASGDRAGELAIEWVSPFVRRAVIEVDRVEGAEPPLANAAGVSWRAIFAQIGWDLTVVDSEVALPQPRGEAWSDAEMHAAMLALRDGADLDSEWRYWLLCVPRLDPDQRGRMFDTDAADSNNVPREAAGIASDWTIPDEDLWGLARGMRFASATDAYFRTAVHELGHAMGLYHNTADNGFMSPTDAVARSAVPPQQFPQNIAWSYEAKDARRLRHMPDPWVRPGGLRYGAPFGTAPSLPRDAFVDLDGLRLEAEPLLAAVPIGAPVRIGLTLHNADGEAVPAPATLSLKCGHVSGSVTDPSGTVRSFRSLVRRTDRELASLRPGDTRAGSITLLRGGEGALFPMPGAYTIDVRVEWEIERVPVRLAANAAVMVLAATERTHAEAALKVLSSPDALLALALGGDHLEDGIAAIRAALASDVLRPHFGFVEARRLAVGFQDRAPDLDAAAELIDADTVMSAAEVENAARLVAGAGTDRAAAPTRLVEVLRSKAEDANAGYAQELLAR